MGFDQETLAGEDCLARTAVTWAFSFRSANCGPGRRPTARRRSIIRPRRPNLWLWRKTLLFWRLPRTDGLFSFWTPRTGKVLQPVEGHRNPPSVLFRSDGSLISYDESKICLWTGGDWRFRTSFEFHDKGQRFYVGPSQNFFVRTVGTKVETRNLESGKVIKEWTLKSTPDFAFLLPDGKTVAAGYLYQFYQSEEPQYKVPERLFVRLLDVSSGGQKEIALPYQPWEIKASPTKALLALKHRDYLDILDIASGKLRRVMDDKTVDFSLLEFRAQREKGLLVMHSR